MASATAKQHRPAGTDRQPPFVLVDDDASSSANAHYTLEVHPDTPRRADAPPAAQARGRSRLAGVGSTPPGTGNPARVVPRRQATTPPPPTTSQPAAAAGARHGAVAAGARGARAQWQLRGINSAAAAVRPLAPAQQAPHHPKPRTTPQQRERERSGPVLRAPSPAPAASSPLQQPAAPSSPSLCALDDAGSQQDVVTAGGEHAGHEPQHLTQRPPPAALSRPPHTDPGTPAQPPDAPTQQDDAAAEPATQQQPAVAADPAAGVRTAPAAADEEEVLALRRELRSAHEALAELRGANRDLELQLGALTSFNRTLKAQLSVDHLAQASASDLGVRRCWLAAVALLRARVRERESDGVCGAALGAGFACRPTRSSRCTASWPRPRRR